MGYVTLTITERVNDISKTENIHFESFEDFMAYKEMVAKLDVANSDSVMSDEELENGGWISWHGQSSDGPDNLDSGTVVEYRRRDGEVEIEAVGDYDWSWGLNGSETSPYDIVAYRVQK
jgi:hypothetical protein